MKRFVLTALMALVMILSAFADGKISFRAEKQLSAVDVSNAKGLNGAREAKSPNLCLNIYTLKDVEARSIVERVREIGGHVNVATRHCISASLPADRWREVAQWDEVRAIDVLSDHGAMFLDNAHSYVGTDKVHNTALAQAAGLPQGYTGKGTLVAVVDNCIDINHSAFRTPDGHSRIVYAASIVANSDDLSIIDVVPYSPEELESGTCEYRGTQSGSHGTHTSSIAGGSGTLDGLYRGVAPEAGLILIDLSSYDGEKGIQETSALATQIVDSVATALNMPVSLSFSVGSVGGALDGTSIEQEAFEEFTGSATRPGRCISVASGNNAYSNGHLRYTFTSDTDTIRSVIALTSFMNDYYFQEVEIWDRDNLPFTARLVVRDADYNIVYASDYIRTTEEGEKNFSYVMEPSHGTLNFNVVSMWSAKNEKYSIGLKLTSLPYYGGLEKDDYIVELEIAGRKDAAIDMVSFNGTDAYSIYGSEVWAYKGVTLPEDVAATYRTGENQQLTNSFALSPYIISVGCGITSLEYNGQNGNQAFVANKQIYGEDGPQVGDPVDWSNYSTFYSDHAIPHLIAPGSVILAAVNRYNSEVEKEVFYAEEYFGDVMPYGVQQGTSMATPYVAGTAALLFQLNPEYTTAEIRDLMMQNTQNMERLHTLYMNPAQYGAGFLDVLATVKAALGDPAVVRGIAVANAGSHAPVKYIQNGKIVIAKDGVNYNVAGQRIE